MSTILNYAKWKMLKEQQTTKPTTTKKPTATKTTNTNFPHPFCNEATAQALVQAFKQYPSGQTSGYFTAASNPEYVYQITGLMNDGKTPGAKHYGGAYYLNVVLYKCIFNDKNPVASSMIFTKNFTIEVEDTNEQEAYHAKNEGIPVANIGRALRTSQYANDNPGATPLPLGIFALIYDDTNKGTSLLTFYNNYAKVNPKLQATLYYQTEQVANGKIPAKTSQFDGTYMHAYSGSAKAILAKMAKPAQPVVAQG